MREADRGLLHVLETVAKGRWLGHTAGELTIASALLVEGLIEVAECSAGISTGAVVRRFTLTRSGRCELSGLRLEARREVEDSAWMWWEDESGWHQGRRYDSWDEMESAMLAGGFLPTGEFCEDTGACVWMHP